jgi:hypothetical protein
MMWLKIKCIETFSIIFLFYVFNNALLCLISPFFIWTFMFLHELFDQVQTCMYIWGYPYFLMET